MKRASKADIAQIAERLSARDWQILGFIDQHRYASTTHLRRMFFTGHATQSAATRACIRVLDRLLTLRILTRLERRIGGNLRGSAAYIWCLDIIGDRLMTPADTPRRRFHEPSYLFLTHTLAITETHVQLVEAERAGHFQVARIEIETQAWRSYLTPLGATSILKPDLMAILSTPDYDDHWYLESTSPPNPSPFSCASATPTRTTGPVGAPKPSTACFPAFSGSCPPAPGANASKPPWTPTPPTTSASSPSPHPSNSSTSYKTLPKAITTPTAPSTHM